MKIAKKRKPILWMAGDSTMQSYAEDQRPQWGWGECLLEILEVKFVELAYQELAQAGVIDLPKAPYEPKINSLHREDCAFPQQKRYVGSFFELDNCAMAGRSSKTFREEGRLQDISEHIQKGDYLIIQFGHNDAGKSKPERYVALEDFKASLAPFVEVALSHEAKPVFISSIVLCPGPQIAGEAEEISRLLPEYGEVMRQYAEELGCPFIDMNRMTGEFISGKAAQEQEGLYKPDHVHLVYEGARAYATLVAEEMKRYL